MSSNFNVPLLGFDKETLMENGKSILIKTLIVNSLIQTYPDESISGEEKLKRFVLAEKVHKDANIYTVEELTEIKHTVSKGFAPLIVGRIFQLIEGGILGDETQA